MSYDVIMHWNLHIFLEISLKFSYQGITDFFFEIMYEVMSVSEDQLGPTFYDTMDCSPPGSSAHEIFQARILECVAISSSRESS